MAARGARCGARNISSILPKWSLWGNGSRGTRRVKKREFFYLVRIARSFWEQWSTAMSFISSFDVFDRKAGPTGTSRRVFKPCKSKASETNLYPQSRRFQSDSFHGYRPPDQPPQQMCKRSLFLKAVMPLQMKRRRYRVRRIANGWWLL